MKNIAMIQNGIVQNIAVWDGISIWNPGPQFTLVDVTNKLDINGNAVSIEWSYDGNNFSPPQGD